MKTKQMITMAAMALMLGMVSCGKEEGEQQSQPQPAPEVEPFDADGATVALFSVSPTRQVRFSRGNLQYQASTDTWRFAGQQYDIVGDDNGFIADDNEGWIDLFGWGTSGWESGAVAWQPWSTSTVDADYYPGGDFRNRLVGNYANADWGVFNAIANGGNRAGMWRVLTDAEWRYLIDGGSQRSGKWSKATVVGMSGMVVLPDDWTLPDGLSFAAKEQNYSANVYTHEEWERMERAGAVFLPAAGFRNAVWPNYVGQWGAYWSSSYYNADAALSLVFSSNSYHPQDGEHRFYGMSVRLVRDK